MIRRFNLRAIHIILIFNEHKAGKMNCENERISKHENSTVAGTTRTRDRNHGHHGHHGNHYHDTLTTLPSHEHQETRTSNEYVLNVAFFSFLIFMIAQTFFAIIARSQSMLADSMAMSVDAFTYLFNLAAERLKHRTYDGRYDDENANVNVSVEEKRRRKKIMRLYLEFIPPLISVTALVIVSAKSLMEAITTIVYTPISSPSAEYPDAGVEEEEPNVDLMLIFSSLNLALDVMNVACFSKLQNFSMTGDMTVKGDDSNAELELEDVNDEEVALIESAKKDIAIASKKERKEFPPSIIDTSIDSSFESDCVVEVEVRVKVKVEVEGDGLLGIPFPNYGSQKSDNEWSEDFSLDAVCSENASAGLTSDGGSAETGDSGSAYSNSDSWRSKTKVLALDIGPDELDGISEGDENSGLSEGDGDGKGDSDDNDSEKSGRGFNMNMCSAYTVSPYICSSYSCIIHMC